MTEEYKKKIITLGALCLFMLGGAVILTYLGQRKVSQQRAFGTGATLKLTTTNASPNVNDEFVVEAKIDTAEKITVYRLALTYDKTKLQIVSIGTGASFEVGPKFGYANGFSNDANAGILTMQSAYAIPASGTRDPNDLPTGTNVLLAKFKVKALVAGAAEIGFTGATAVAQTIINGYNPGSDDVVVNVTTKTPLALSVGSVTRLGEINVKLDPKDGAKALNQNFDVDVKVETGTNKISFMQLGFTFDKDKLQIVKFTPNPDWFAAQMFTDTEQDYGTTTGIASIRAASLLANPPVGTLSAGKLTLKGKVNGTATLTIKKDSTSYLAGSLGTGTSSDGTFSIGTTEDGSWTIGNASASGERVLNFKVKFQGVTSQRADQKVKIIIKKPDGTIAKTIDNVNVTADSSGIYSGSTGFANIGDNPPIGGTGYSIFIKGPKHLARKFCKDNQTARCTAGEITLTTGTNTFDFSKILLEAGDLPNPNSANAQDGVVNSVDASLIEARLAKSDTASTSVADVNFDGIVNIGDMSLLLNTLETKYEEDY